MPRLISVRDPSEFEFISILCRRMMLMALVGMVDSRRGLDRRNDGEIGRTADLDDRLPAGLDRDDVTVAFDSYSLVKALLANRVGASRRL